MSILHRFIGVYIPRKILDEKCKHLGGFNGALELNKRWVGKKVLYDDYLYKDGAMGPADIEDIIEFWEKNGLTLTEEKNGQLYWKDLAVVDLVMGLTLPCEWLEYDPSTSLVSMIGTR